MGRGERLKRRGRKSGKERFYESSGMTSIVKVNMYYTGTLMNVVLKILNKAIHQC